MCPLCEGEFAASRGQMFAILGQICSEPACVGCVNSAWPGAPLLTSGITVISVDWSDWSGSSPRGRNPAACGVVGAGREEGRPQRGGWCIIGAMNNIFFFFCFWLVNIFLERGDLEVVRLWLWASMSSELLCLSLVIKQKLRETVIKIDYTDLRIYFFLKRNWIWKVRQRGWRETAENLMSWKTPVHFMRRNNAFSNKTQCKWDWLC